MLPPIPLDLDLSLFSRWLSYQGVSHRIIEERGEQVLVLQDQRYAEQVSEALRQYVSDLDYRARLSDQLTELTARQAKRGRRVSASTLADYARATPRQAPVIFGLIAISILFAFLSDFGQGGPLLRIFLIIDPFKVTADMSTVGGRWEALLDMLITGEAWRLVTPDFIHFNAMHITFNLLMLWVLGGQLEIQKGSLSFVALTIFVSIISNISQLLETSYLFGGLSGVVYGLVGYCWLWKRYDDKIFFPTILMKFSLVWLLMGYTPLTEWLGLGKMANAAHLYGLIAGLVWAAVTLYVNERLLPGQKKAGS